MSVRFIPLFENGRPTPFLMAQWRKKGGLQPLNARVAYLDENRCANPVLRGLWAATFSDLGPLPTEPLADRDGRGTQAFWNVFG